MSSADARRRSRVAELVGSVLGLLASLGLVAAMLLTRPTAAPATGVGDPYYPEAGGSGYDATSYAVELVHDPDSGRLAGATTVSLLATRALKTLHLDLLLHATAVTVNGAPVGFRQTGEDLAVDLPQVLGVATTRAGGRLEVRVEYEGVPHELRFGTGSPVYRAGSELLISGEPEGAAAWFPVNDHPSDPATYDITVSVPAGVETVSVGELRGRGADPARAGNDVWHWVTDVPSPSYTTMLAIGQYTVKETQVTVGGRERQAVYAVSERVPDPARAMAWLETTPAAIAAAEKYLGPYPATGVGGVVPGVKPWWGGLETLGRPVYHPNVVGSGSVLLHEIAHMWLGDRVTLAQWRSIFINESLTSYVEWLTVADRGGTPVQKRFDDAYAKNPSAFWTQQLSDPGAGEKLFTRVYDRGPMVVHALRTRMGDEAFFAFLRSWAQQQGPRSLDDFRAAAAAASPTDVRPLLAAWLDGTTKPASTPENGFR